ncbi:BTB/POZ-like [Lasallia pustulata]|uniref:BTB/POZ-like n=1 Tax=Lasallia pustulata TaxID=136370 RepID=A0A1W5D900_9LECA|nr:BTB/POZ-like [Lasallia pustulata]
MSDISQSIYASSPFKFVVDGSPYYIHADLASSHSRPFDCMINGPMAEAQKGFAVLEDVEKGTFERFTEWAYKGYYTAANFDLSIDGECKPPEGIPEAIEWPQKPLTNAPAVMEGNDEPEYEPEYNIQFPVPMRMEKHRKKRESYRDLSCVRCAAFSSQQARISQELKESFLRCEYTVRQDVIGKAPTRANQGANEDYTEVFLSHARLYVFAERYDIQPLRTLALEELHSTLAVYTLYHERTGDIVALLRYVYANTGVLTRGGEDLRSVLRDYVAIEISVLVKDEELNNLMLEDGGPLLQDIMKMFDKRIN